MSVDIAGNPIDLADADRPLPPLIVYHSPCLDGFTAAWAAWLQHPNAEFHPGVYGEAPPDCVGRDVYLLDFSYKRPVMEQIITQARSVTVLDHHKTAEADLAGLGSEGREAGVVVVFDQEHSGAYLAWKWFHPTAAVPRLVEYVEDRDLWRFALNHSREINAALFSYEYDFKTWSRLAETMDRSSIDGPVGLDPFITEGAAILRKQDKDVQELVTKTRRHMTFTRAWGLIDEWVPTANLPYTLASDAGNLMAQIAPFAATYYIDSKGDYVFSLRSTKAGTDVSAIAALYGGGGHKHAAGFRVRGLEEL